MTERPGISLEEWYPLVQPIVPTPVTVIERTDVDLARLLEGSVDGHDEAIATGLLDLAVRLARAADHVGIGYPLFLRTGMGSGKHEWTDTCHVPSREALTSHIMALVEWSELVDFVGLPSDVWVARELLPTVAPFTAFGGFPVTKERRYFIEDGKVLGHHPYWPPFTIVAPSITDWRDALSELNHEDAEEHDLLAAQSLKVAAAVPGAWSVDWLWVPENAWQHVAGNAVAGGQWFLTDMAWAERSYVWDTHPCVGEAAKFKGPPSIADELLEMDQDADVLHQQEGV